MKGWRPMLVLPLRFANLKDTDMLSLRVDSPAWILRREHERVVLRFSCLPLAIVARIQTTTTKKKRGEERKCSLVWGKIACIKTTRSNICWWRSQLSPPRCSTLSQCWRQTGELATLNAGSSSSRIVWKNKSTEDRWPMKEATPRLALQKGQTRQRRAGSGHISSHAAFLRNHSSR